MTIESLLYKSKPHTLCHFIHSCSSDENNYFFNRQDFDNSKILTFLHPQKDRCTVQSINTLLNNTTSSVLLKETIAAR